jgi:flagellar biosynthesis protein FliP
MNLRHPWRSTPPAPARRSGILRLLTVVVIVLAALVAAGSAAGAQTPEPPTVELPQIGPPAPRAPAEETADPSASISIDLQDVDGKPSQSVILILVLTLLSVAPALLIMLTSFTRIAIVLSLTRNALGLQTVPPNQVIVGLALFLILFVMAPTIEKINENALQPLLAGELTQAEAYDEAVGPIREFMLSQTREAELKMFVAASGAERPETRDDVALTSLIPAFILSELKTAFIIGFIVFVPFLVIDIVVASSLMSMGMMMLPPVLVSLPFKLLLFVMVDGWGLITKSLLTSFNS